MYSDIRDNNRILFVGMLNQFGVPLGMQEKILNLVDGTDFFIAPASTKYHGAYPGGLFDHSMMVTDHLIRWTQLGLCSWERAESPIIVGMLHDFTKVNKYGVKPDENGQYDEENPVYSYNKDAVSFGGHGSDSLIKIALKLPLTEEEAMCIRFHMGAYEGKEAWKDYDKAIRQHPNVLWTHQADMVASKICGV